MQRPAELDLALYVDHLAAAEPDTGSYAAGITESESAERDDRKPVHLADLFAVRLDTDRLARDFLLQAAIDTVAAAELGIDRPLHLGRSDDLFAGPNRNLVGLLQQIDDPAQAGRQPLGIAGKARRVLDRARDRAAIEWQQLLAAYHRGDETGVEQGRFRGPLDAVVKIGRNFEQFFEIVVEGAQQIVDERRAKQHDLDVERDRLGLQRHGARQAQQLLQALEVDLPGIERALQGGPAEISGKQPLRVEHEITAIGAVQRARCQQIEVGD